MTTKKLGKILVKSSIIGAMALTYTGCGLQDQKQTKDSAAENSTDLRKNPTDKASLALALPSNLPAAVDEVEVTLSRLMVFNDGCGDVVAASSKVHQLGRPCMWPGASTGPQNALGQLKTVKKPSATSPDIEVFSPISSETFNGSISDTVFTQIFQIKGQAIQINDLEAGDYWVTVSLVNSSTGHVYSHGEGKATIQAGKQATARISMTKLEETTGGLVIILDDASVPPQGIKPLPRPMPPQICNLMAKAPVCVAPGKSAHYEVYQFQRAPNSCEFLPLPLFFTQVPDKLCKGLSDVHNTPPKVIGL
ncbi:MAG: hypothetical protein NTY08_13050 [Proteobacteria bacterium]|nr:hypothetical protein [Pseudomonadota bacterium]